MICMALKFYKMNHSTAIKKYVVAWLMSGSFLNHAIKFRSTQTIMIEIFFDFIGTLALSSMP